MKKRVVVYLLMILLLSFAASASVNIDSVEEKYNLGDTILVSGTVLEDADYSGLFRLSFVCDNESFSLPAVPLSLKAGEAKRFPDDFAIPELRVSSGMSGICAVKGVLAVGNVSSEGMSNNFEISKGLGGSFTLNREIVQLGDALKIEGAVFKLSGNGTDGGAEIYLKSSESGRFLVDVANFQNGKIDYTYVAKNLPTADYVLEIGVNDIYGNSQLFEEVGMFSVIKDLSLEFEVSNKNPLPGEQVKLVGSVNTVSTASVFSSGEAVISLDGVEIDRVQFVRDNEYNINLSESARSGEHVVDIAVSDEFGNFGSTSLTFDVSAVAKGIDVTVRELDVFPGGNLVVTSVLMDQAGELMRDSVSIEVFDSKDNEIFKKVVMAGEEVEIGLDAAALPGQWKVKTSNIEFSKEINFNVVRANKIRAEINNQSLVITNVGNVVYNKPIEVNIGNDITLIKKNALKVGEVLEIHLDEEVRESGAYTVKVLDAKEPNVFENVKIYGKPRVNLTILYWLLIIVVVVLLMLLLKKKRRHTDVVRKKEVFEKKKGEEDGKILREKKKEKPGWTREDSIKEYRERLKKDMERSAIDAQRQKFSRRAGYVPVGVKKTRQVKKEEVKEEKKEEGSGGAGLFSMFD